MPASEYIDRFQIRGITPSAVHETRSLKVQFAAHKIGFAVELETSICRKRKRHIKVAMTNLLPGDEVMSDLVTSDEAPPWVRVTLRYVDSPFPNVCHTANLIQRVLKYVDSPTREPFQQAVVDGLRHFILGNLRDFANLFKWCRQYIDGVGTVEPILR